MSNFIYEISGDPVVLTAWMLILAFLLITILYLFRSPFHRIVDVFFVMMHKAMRFTAASVLLAENRLSERNREVLMAEGLVRAERILEKKFVHINNAVAKDLGGCPAAHGRMLEVLRQLEDDYAKTKDLPPELPNWTPVIEAVARIKNTEDAMISNMLGVINLTLTEQHKSAIEAYKEVNAKRHSLLNKRLANWRALEKTLTGVETSISNMEKRAKSIDRYMENYKEIKNQTGKAIRNLTSSSLTRFFISFFFMLIVLSIASVTFNFISTPMTEIIGDGHKTWVFRTADLTAITMILLNISLGAVLTETFQITKLFHMVGSMDDRRRYWLIGVTMTILTLLACVESGLAFMRDQIGANSTALNQFFSGVENVVREPSRVPMVAQMLLAFVLTFMLAFTAIPFESFISSFRTVIGYVGETFLRFLAFLLRLSGATGIYFGKLVIAVYDFLIYPSLWIEALIRQKRENRKTEPVKEAVSE